MKPLPSLALAACVVALSGCSAPSPQAPASTPTGPATPSFAAELGQRVQVRQGDHLRWTVTASKVVTTPGGYALEMTVSNDGDFVQTFDPAGMICAQTEPTGDPWSLTGTPCKHLQGPGIIATPMPLRPNEALTGLVGLGSRLPVTLAWTLNDDENPEPVAAWHLSTR